MPLELGFDARTEDDRKQLKLVNAALDRLPSGPLCDGGSIWREWYGRAQKLSEEKKIDIEEALDQVLAEEFRGADGT